MKLTWFGGRAFRIYVGGSILVLEPEEAGPDVDRSELVSGADQVVSLRSVLDVSNAVDLAQWQPRRLGRLLDEGEREPVLVHRFGEHAALVDAAGEPPLVLLSGRTAPLLGRWASGAVAVLIGQEPNLAALGVSLLEQSPPRLLALASDVASADTAIAALRDRLQGASLVALELRQALEI